MIKPIDDDEPLFRVRYHTDRPIKYNDGYWEQYNTLNKSWFRLCAECAKRVCESSESLCTFHYNKENNPTKNIKLKPTNMKKAKRLNRKVKKKKDDKQDKLLEEMIVETEVEQTIKDEYEELDESLGIVISISSSLNKKQISQVKEFITQFHNNPHSIQFTWESQTDYIDDTTTHVITNDFGSFTTTLTKQIIQACVRHIFISSINWIISSLDQSSVLDHFSFEILRDKKSLIDSRGIKQCRFDQLPVFPSSSIISVECHQGIKPMKMTRDEFIDIIELSGASLIDDFIEYKTLIIFCNTKKEMIYIKEQNEDNSMKINEKKIYYCKPKFLFDSIVRHEVQPIKKYLW